MHPLFASFPDLHHVMFLRDRLWARQPLGRAAVMVGAGFSLNAEARVAGAPAFPLWRELTGLLLDRLRPALTPAACSAALDLAVSGAGSLTLALEFEATFGRSALDELLLSRVPDQDHIPGPLHQALLALPWADVFTTNYDTLLERTPASEHHRSYDVVVQPADLPNTTPPRIVKLHGSLPATKPFIITEEDFRRYPKACAPFVNTVQQAMLENDFVLLGFSGDDPNFLSWLGWVRDELATLHPRVYLCGVLDLSPAQRTVLRERGVTAIDLGYLFPAASYPANPGQRNRDALAWLLYSLANGEAREAQELPLFWPEFPDLATGNRWTLPLPPLAIPRESFEYEDYHSPRQRPTFAEETQARTFSPEAVTELLATLAHWQKVRAVYPGWVALLRTNRATLRQRTKPWGATLEAWARTLPAAGRLRPLAELTWRMERAMQVIDSTQTEQLYEDTLANLTIPEAPEPREQWATIVFFYLRHLRYEYRHADFEQLLARTEPLAGGLARHAAGRCWQAALERLEHLDPEGARRWLRRWPDVPGEPVWDVRRAGLWGELGELELAERYAALVLNTAVQRQPRGAVRLDMLAVEAEASRRLSQIREAAWWQDDERGAADDLWRTTRHDRDRERLYRTYRCEANPAGEHLADALRADVPAIKLTVYETINPFSGTRVRTRTSGGGFELDWLQPAFDVLDSFEARGHPYQLPHTTYSVLAAASRWLLAIYPTRALGVILRTANDKLLKPLLDQAAVLAFREEQLLPLAEQALTLLEQSFPAPATGRRPGFSENSQLGQVALALLLVGRTAFRLPDELRGRAVQLALAVWAQWPYELVRRRNLHLEAVHYDDFTRGLVAVMRAEEVAANLAQLVAAVPVSGFSAGPFNALPDSLLPARRPATEAFAAAVQFCLGCLPEADMDRRQTGLRRLARLSHLDWLTPAESARYGELLWQGSDGEPDALPDLHNWYRSFLLHAPHPASVDPAAHLKRDLLRRAAQFREALAASPAPFT